MTNTLVVLTKFMDCGLMQRFCFKNNVQEGPPIHSDILERTKIREWVPSEYVKV